MEADSSRTTAASPFCMQADLLDRFACYAEHAADGVQLLSRGTGQVSPPGEREIFMVLEAMNLTQDMASSARYAWYQHQLGAAFTPPDSADQGICLDNGFGICGNHQSVFLELMAKVGVPARPVNFWYTDTKLNERANHAAAEVKIAGKWRYVDITWGTMWLQRKRDPLSALSVEEVLKGEGWRLTGSTNTWYLAQRQRNIDPFSYLYESDVQITRSGGTLVLHLSNKPETFIGLPNYVGKPPNSDPLSFVVRQPKAGGRLEIVVSGASICTKSKLMVGDQAFEIESGTVLNATYDKREVSVRVVGADENCYAVFASMTRKPLAAVSSN